MKSPVTTRVFALLSSSIIFSLLMSAQNVSPLVMMKPEDSIAHLVLKKLSPPVYPLLARQAMIEGDVALKIVVRPDGGIESVTVTSGHPLLMQAALDSAKQSQFECLACGTSDASRTLRILSTSRSAGIPTHAVVPTRRLTRGLRPQRFRSRKTTSR